MCSLSGGPEGLEEDLEAGGVSGQLEQPQDPNNAVIQEIKVISGGGAELLII